MAGKAQFDGLLAIKKPTGVTSHDVVDQVRKIVRQRSVGHTGTLDPLASGLILLCLGNVTKLARFFSGQDKTYQATVRLGLTSVTMDAEGIDDSTSQTVPDLSKAQITETLNSFLGNTMQTVPLHSAVRVNGERLYEKARRGEEVTIPSREICISRIELDDLNLPEFKFTASVSSGTYIRSLAHDIGQKLGCGAYLSALKRTSIGFISIAEAITVDDLSALAQDETIPSRFIPLDIALGFGSIMVNEKFSARVAQGRTLKNDDIQGMEGQFDAGEYILMKSPEGLILAVGTALKNSASFRDGSAGELFSYERVLV